MNPYQRMVLAVSAAVIAIMCLFPPWLHVDQFPTRARIEQPIGYRPLWRVPEITRFTTARIDTTRLGIQIVAAVMVTLMLWLVLNHAERRTGRQICAACEGQDHSYHDSEACTNPASREPDAAQCECAARVPAGKHID